MGAEADSEPPDERCGPTARTHKKQNGSRVSRSPLIAGQPVAMWQVWDQAGKSSQRDEGRTGVVQGQAQRNYGIARTRTEGGGLSLNATPEPAGEACVCGGLSFSRLFSYGIEVFAAGG